MNENNIAEVLVTNVENKSFYYQIPASLKEKIKIGKIVKIPFGSQQQRGYIIGFKNKKDVPDLKLKEIFDVIDEEPLFNEELLKLAKWISRYYLSPLNSTISLITPINRNIRFIKEYRIKKDINLQDENLSDIQKNILLYLLQKNTSVELKKIKNALNIKNISYHLKVLEQKNLLFATSKLYIPKRKQKHKEYRYDGLDYETQDKEIILQEEQKKIVDEIVSLSEKNKPEIVLLKGVTSSGKTEIYIRVILKLVSSGKSAIVLVPEISLTPQIEKRFRKYFGDTLSVLHSRVPERAKFDIYKKIRNGEIKVVIGARSSIFAPMKNLGIIVIDEEHEASYKQDNNPRYHAREVAIARAKLNNAILILGSATPSIETYFFATHKIYKLMELKNRVGNIPLPEIEIVDMRKEKDDIISEKLKNEIKNSLLNKQQIILFLNRRGFSNIVLCKRCGFIFQCKNCSVSLTYHKVDKKLRCHYCNYCEDIPYICSNCKSTFLYFKGIGIQQVEEKIKSEFEDIKILRMDKDTTKTKFSHYDIISKFERHQADILLGTQMIAKGLDFKNVSLVGVISADTSFYFPDFRAGEKTFQLITQVAGRAGRFASPGKVIIQTYLPQHYAIEKAISQNYEDFFCEEIKLRKDLFYPPFSHIINIGIEGTDEKKIIDICKKVIGILQETINDKTNIEILGHSPSPIPKIKNKFRYNIIIKTKRIKDIIAEINFLISKMDKTEKEYIFIDVDPQNLL